MTELTKLTIAEARDRLRAGDFTAREVAEHLVQPGKSRMGNGDAMAHTGGAQAFALHQSFEY